MFRNKAEKKRKKRIFLKKKKLFFHQWSGPWLAPAQLAPAPAYNPGPGASLIDTPGGWPLRSNDRGARWAQKYISLWWCFNCCYEHNVTLGWFRSYKVHRQENIIRQPLPLLLRRLHRCWHHTWLGGRLDDGHESFGMFSIFFIFMFSNCLQNRLCGLDLTWFVLFVPVELEERAKLAP